MWNCLEILLYVQSLCHFDGVVSMVIILNALISSDAWLYTSKSAVVNMLIFLIVTNLCEICSCFSRRVLCLCWTLWREEGLLWMDRFVKPQHNHDMHELHLLVSSIIRISARNLTLLLSGFAVGFIFFTNGIKVEDCLWHELLMAMMMLTMFAVQIWDFHLFRNINLILAISFDWYVKLQLFTVL